MTREEDMQKIGSVVMGNAQQTEKNTKIFDQHNVFSIELMGSPGCGKTALLEKIIDKTDIKLGVFVGDIISRYDADRIRKHNIPVVELDTQDEENKETNLLQSHVDANLLNTNMDKMPLDDIDLAIVENVGNIICPSIFPLGCHKKIVMVSVSEGDDTVEKHKSTMEIADMIIINKIDIAEPLDADADKMVEDAKKINPNATVIATSVKKDIGIDEVIDTIKELMK